VAFQKYLSGFKAWGQAAFAERMFGSMQQGLVAGRTAEGAFLPTSLPCDCQESNDVSWYKGSIVRRGKVVVAFMKRFCADSHSSERASFTEDIVITYSRDGRIIDSRILGRDGRTAFSRKSGDLGRMTFTVQQASLADAHQIYEYGDLHYNMVKYRYAVDAAGKIKATPVGKAWKETVARDRETAGTFGSLLAHFPLWGKADVEASAFGTTAATKELSHAAIKAFVPASADCECEPRELAWYAGYRMEQNGFVVLFMKKDCAVPAKAGYPYSDEVMAVFTKDGKLTDFRSIARYGDLWVAETKGTSEPLSVVVKQGVIDEKEVKAPQAAEVTICSYAVDGAGKITRTVQGSPYRTALKYNAEKNVEEMQ
jgi:hypothetical protein